MALEKYEHHFSPEELVGFIYAVLHAPTYRAKYAEFLCAPVCGTSFRSLSEASGGFRDRRRMPPRGVETIDELSCIDECGHACLDSGYGDGSASVTRGNVAGSHTEVDPIRGTTGGWI
jgi:Type ISP C-terminal specificity domain